MRVTAEFLEVRGFCWCLPGGSDPTDRGILPTLGTEIKDTNGVHVGGISRRGSGDGERVADHNLTASCKIKAGPSFQAQDELGDGVHVCESVVGGDCGAGAAVVQEHQAHAGALLDALGDGHHHGLRSGHHLLAL